MSQRAGSNADCVRQALDDMSRLEPDQIDAGFPVIHDVARLAALRPQSSRASQQNAVHEVFQENPDLKRLYEEIKRRLYREPERPPPADTPPKRQTGVHLRIAQEVAVHLHLRAESAERRADQLERENANLRQQITSLRRSN